MLALTAATHGQDPTQILTLLAAVGAAIFWRILLKVALALIVIGFVILVIRVVNGESALIRDLLAVLK